MKFTPSRILIEIEKGSEKISPILFYGNEEGLMSGIIKSICNTLKKKITTYDIQYFDHKDLNDEKFEHLLKSSSLFSKINLIVLKNPQDRLTAQLKNIKSFDNLLIIRGENITTKSKIKSYFDTHPSFMSVPCYSLDRNYIKKTIDNFLGNNKIILQKEAYWFLIDNISEDYLTLKNELKKLYIYKNSSATIENLQKLIIQKHNISADSYFFNCASGNLSLLLQDINSSSRSISESYEILISLKKFMYILSQAVFKKNNYNLDDLVKTYLPKYLFLKKEIFREILSKANLSKITKINKMLQKTEYLLRKNASQHREILERFLLNLVKIMR